MWGGTRKHMVLGKADCKASAMSQSLLMIPTSGCLCWVSEGPDLGCFAEKNSTMYLIPEKKKKKRVRPSVIHMYLSKYETWLGKLCNFDRLEVLKKMCPKRAGFYVSLTATALCNIHLLSTGYRYGNKLQGPNWWNFLSPPQRGEHTHLWIGSSNSAPWQSQVTQRAAGDSSCSCSCSGERCSLLCYGVLCWAGRQKVGCCYQNRLLFPLLSSLPCETCQSGEPQFCHARQMISSQCLKFPFSCLYRVSFEITFQLARHFADVQYISLFGERFNFYSFYIILSSICYYFILAGIYCIHKHFKLHE